MSTTPTTPEITPTSTSTPPKGNTWTCKTCTLVNSLTSTTCTACMAPRPVINYVPAARARTSSVTNWRDEYETWARSYKIAAVPIELVSVGERSSSLCLSLAGHLTVIQCPTQSTSTSTSTTASTSTPTSTSTSTSASTHDTPFSIEVDFHDLDQQINTWITEQSSLTLAHVLDHLIITYQHIKNNKKTHDDEWGDGDTAIADGDDDWGDADVKTDEIDNEGDSVMDDWGNDTDMKHTGDWNDDDGFIDDDDELNTRQQDHEKALRRRWLAKEAELRAKSKKKSILEDVEYKGSSKQIFTPQEISTMLINTLLTCKREATKNGLDVEPIDDNIFHWRLRYLRFSANTQIQKDLVGLESMYGHAWIELEIEFDMHLYPFFPPTVKPVWPRLENFIMGRLVCLDVLLLSGWSPVRAISDIFASIYRLLSQYGSINVDNPVNDPDGDAMKKGSGLYTDAEYQLWRLSMLTEIAPRANVLMTDKKSSESLELPKMSTNLVKQASWTKHKADDVEAYVAHLAAQRKKNEEIRQILGITLAELSYPTVNSIFISMLSQSCILPFLSHYLTCTNLVDIDRSVEMYTSVFALLRGMSCHPSLCQLLRVTKISSTNTQRSLQSLMQELWKLAKSMENNKNGGLSAPLLNLIRLTHTEMETAIHTTATLPSDDPKLPTRSTSTLSRTTSQKSHVVEEKQACPICNVEFARSEIERHVDACMDRMDDEVEIISTRSPSTSPSPTSSSPLSTSSSSSTEMSTCPICNDEFSQSTIERHVDRCLTQTQQKHDERVAKDLAKIREKTPKTGFFSRKRTSTSSGSTTPTGLSPTSTIKHRIERDEKQAAKSGPTEACVVCFSSFPSTSIKTHTASCWKCTICARAFDRNEIRQHVKECIAHGKIEEEEKVAIHFTRKQQGILNKMQLDAVCWIQQQAQKQSELVHDSTVARFKKLGKTEHDLKLVLRYIRNTAPIIIHLMADTVLPFLVKDTHYRNQFETNTSKGTLCHSTRVGWEDRMYNRIYHNASGFDRVKYGVLNVSNSPNGVAACRSYGDSYLLLQNVRLRTTFANMDTGSDTATLASCEYYTHILNTFTDKELLDVWEVAAGRKQCMDSTATSTYKEIQIHGPVQLNRDVQAIVMNARHKNDTKLCEMLKTFAETNHIAVIWMDQKLSTYQ